MCSEKPLDVYKQQLLNMQQQLQQDSAAAEQSSATVELDQQSVGRLSRMDAMQAQAMAQGLERRRAQQRTEVIAALRRIDSGDFGFCQDCDEPINPKRLAVNPTCRYCLNCAEHH